MNKFLKCNAIENPILWYLSYYKYKTIETFKNRWKFIFFFIFWIYFFKICYQNEFMMIFIILTSILLIFFNLDFSQKKPGSVSAYSVFNKNFEKIAGTFTPDDLLNEMNIRKIDSNIERISKKDLFDPLKKTEEKFKDPHEKCDCGSNKKFKNCCMKNKQN